MLNNKVVLDEAFPVPALTPDLVAKLRKEDMKQAVVERFRASSEKVNSPTKTRKGKRSPYWQRADDEC